MSSKDIIVPQLAESITEGTIVKWLVKEGEEVEKDNPIVELETDKVNVEINTDYTGVLEKIIAGPGTDVVVGETIARITEGSPVHDSQQNEKEEIIEVDNTDHQEELTESISRKDEPDSESALLNVPATPSARKYAREHGLSLNELDRKLVESYGRIGRREAELIGSLKNGEKEQSNGFKNGGNKTGDTEVEETPLQNTNSERPTERRKMSRRRMTIAKRLVEAQQEAAMLTTFNEVDMTNVMKLRKERKEKFKEKHGVKLGFMSFFTKAVVAALKDFPLLNAEIEGNELIIKNYFDIGIAVATDDGLVVPVVRNADKLDFAGIERKIGELSERARNNELEIADLQGGSFTITNGGVFGSLLSTPILNAPQVGILGMHTIQKRPVAMPDDTIEIRPMMYLAVSYDHRIVDGKEAVQFLVRIKQLLEDPYDLLLEG
ncbi:2-oxoglutarate dehydrogenase complex dihydrolipoyllysine-residue succinyltransferase [Aciduricibacillus chroicocephali]|uniref:Dihydrolipoyllysine-residue succinyltransferase component of 2-oxoglutarate dehydrogenase complex n=1 Tax=Aciduricibacillus chroicocephali TaxID=3054939 RepID=A0ABY9KX66_9BACI|nr:2-oxoglutarate dehydrogenase complex dihydrolipoyllysine-residue succinyltransferase [Bacillaceae bacterium 44XB]